MITHYFRTVKDSELKTYEKSRAGVWTHVVGPSKEELASIIAEHGLDETIIADTNDFFEVPRFEQEGHASYFFTRYPLDEKDEDINTAPILIIVGELCVITIAQREVPFLRFFISGKKPIVTTQKTKLFLEFMGALIRAYERDLTRMRKSVYRDRTRVRNIKSRDIQRLAFHEQELNDTISALVPTNDWLKQLAKGKNIQFFEEDIELMEDLMIENNQLIESAKSILKTIQNIRSATEAILTQNLNNTIRMLTALTIILTIPTLVSSLYGMNVPLPFGNNPHGFYVILGFIVAVVTITLYFFKRNRWL